jgi:hypothetical protein
MDAHAIAEELSNSYGSRNLNEADTRHQLIDRVLHEVLAWPRNATKCESYIAPGFADYVLFRGDGAKILFIEAKREGDYFQLPPSAKSSNAGAFVKVNTLLTSESLANAMLQVHAYCAEEGCPIAAVTNGHEWVIFRTFVQNEKWRNLKAFVIPSLEYFSKHFVSAVELLSYRSIVDKSSRSTALSQYPGQNRQLYYPKTHVAAFATSMSANNYASKLRPMAEKYFGEIDEDDFEFMNFCYVSDNEYERTFRSALTILRDSLTPYLLEYGVKEIQNKVDGGILTKRMTKNVLERKTEEVLVLFGGKGVGKSTFLRRLLFHNPPQILRKNSVIAIANLLRVPESKEQVHQFIWQVVVNALDTENILDGDRNSLLALFEDRYEEALRQALFGLDSSSDAFNVALNKCVQEWKSDLQYVANRLASRLKSRHKGPIVILDNTDQYSSQIQDYCFVIAHDIARQLQCLVIISMREERFYSSTIHGTLDAFQNSGFHLSSPSARHVFIRRLQFVVRLLSNRAKREQFFGEAIPEETVEKLKRFFRTLEQEFTKPDSHLADFVAACAHGNIRLALEIFRGFILSRYTNINEMTSVGSGWVILIHQVLKPIMIPYRFFYDEAQSHIPNIFQIRSKVHGSHFTALRILRRLSASNDPHNPPYIGVGGLMTEFADQFGMKEDLELNLSVLLKYGLIESSNKIDEYRIEVDSVRITPYGGYLLNTMSRFFTYLDLISADTGIADEGKANALAKASNDEYGLWEVSQQFPKMRVERVNKRLEKADLFVQYLEAEEIREASLYSISNAERFMGQVRQAFDAEKVSVLKSAQRQRYA